MTAILILIGYPIACNLELITGIS